ncbi:uncharacterized protein KY384_000113 [Bacidia gigantensis]|uniref:uncharacterized protein n=1 Tax=Bacidia gigantensis TaxID=2732470 RepID=UPI001D0487D0|nr:uncharacterized protein KY384_000113 [Bacidia gigantensis]KAG8526120.1 hypothetical protein KY384_000113 [Bacidia gigantensis]
MTLSYATAARIFQDSYIRDPVMSYDKKQSYVNLVALSVLSIALIGQTSIATWAYMTTKPRIVTWSSNSLNNALIYKRLSYSGDKSHMGPQDGRSSRVVGTWLALNPEKKQRGLWRARSASIKIVIYIWILAGAALLWAFIAQFVSEASGTDVSVTIAQSKNNGHRTTYIINGDKHVSGNRFHFFVILLVFLVQIPFTLGLHCVELVVNCTRDEKAWRRATTKKGARIDSNAIVGACKSWDTVTLFVLKGAIHWAFGEAGSSAALPAVAGLYLQYLSLFILAFFLGYLAIFTTILTFRKPKGPQPAAWGHLRSLTELIDDWGKDEDPIFWGDKGSSESSRSVRYAGTAAKREIIGPIQMDARYEMGEAISGDAQTKPMSC